ncbi:MAG: class I SAM-dependent methyltransferase [Candidatus Levybacteria bacterium]|nr:class I SAM-dependent methyltransferase [Candidatus Levybacteria bacterium]
MKMSKKFIKLNKDYYRYIEEYDWVDVTDHLHGFESIFHKLRERLMLRFINKYKKEGKFLDAGCGTGLFLRHLPKNSVGIDINPRNIIKAKKYAAYAKIIEGDIENTPFDNEEFSVIVCTEVFEHLPDPKLALKEFKRILHDDGLIIGSVPSISPIWFFRFLSSTCPRGEPYHKNYKKRELIELFKDFKIIKLKMSAMWMSYFFVLRKK